MKRLPLIGGAIESFMDAKDNKKAYENLKKAYQDGTEVPKADGSLSPITDEEWQQIDKQYQVPQSQVQLLKVQVQLPQS